MFRTHLTKILMHFLGGVIVLLIATSYGVATSEPNPWLFPMTRLQQWLLVFFGLLIYPLAGSGAFYAAITKYAKAHPLRSHNMAILAFSCASYIAIATLVRAAASAHSNNHSNISTTLNLLAIVLLFLFPYRLVRGLTLRSTRTQQP